MDSDDDYSSGANSRVSSPESLALSPHPEEENVAPPGSISSLNRTAELKNRPPGLSTASAKRRRLASPTASISCDGAHATPPSAIGGGLMPSSPIKTQQKKDKERLELDLLPKTIVSSSQVLAGIKSKGKKKDTGQGESWEEVLERLGSTACRLKPASLDLILLQLSTAIQPQVMSSKNGKDLT